MTEIKKEELRQLLFFNFSQGVNASATARSINKVYGEGTIAERTAREWFQKFRNGVTTFEDQPGRGRPSSVDHAELKTFVEANIRHTSRDIAREFGVSHSTILDHLKQIGKKKKDGKWVSHNFNED